MKQMIVHECREQIMTGSHRMGVSGQVKVDFLHRNDLGMPATGTTALHSEYRAERRLTQCKSGTMPEPG